MTDIPDDESSINKTADVAEPPRKPEPARNSPPDPVTGQKSRKKVSDLPLPSVAKVSAGLFGYHVVIGCYRKTSTIPPTLTYSTKTMRVGRWKLTSR